jgi:hypothetical protein
MPSLLLCARWPSRPRHLAAVARVYVRGLGSSFSLLFQYRTVESVSILTNINDTPRLDTYILSLTFLSFRRGRSGVSNSYCLS